MPIYRDPEQDRQEKNEEYSLRQEQHHWKLAEQEEMRKHEILLHEMDDNTKIKIKELEVALAKAQGVSREKQITHRAYWVSVIKLPVMPFALLFVFILELMKRDVPQALEDFLNVY